jgi:pimeloyl-ACP methyl ester carboxylesterase
MTMSAQWLAEGFDIAFIRLGIRPTLPVVTSSSRLTRLRQAEERTESGLSDEFLFSPPLAPTVRRLHSRILRSGLRVDAQDWTAPRVPLESEWRLESLAPTVIRTDWYTRSPKRPLLVGVGGWVPIRGLATPMLWPLELLDRIGFDVVLPSFGPRSASQRQLSRVDFPSGEPCRNVLEVAKRVGAIRQTLAHARELGYRRIIVWGSSLGAHLAALLGTISPQAFDLLVLEKPLARLSDSLRLHGCGNDTDRYSAALRLDRVYRAVTALERQPRVESNRVHVIGALYDRVTTFESAQQLAAHFGTACQTIEASHLFDPGRAHRFVTCLGEHGH